MIVTLGGLSYPTRSWSSVSLHMHVSDVYVCGISGRNSFKGGGGGGGGGECETPKKPNFKKKGKIIISLKIQKVFF